MKKLEQSLKNATANLGRSVVKIVYDEKEITKDVLFYGLKNTSLPQGLIEKLRGNPQFVQLTIDKMSHIGRSIDVDLINPITYRLMTGSSSGSAVNILLGINDFAIGTDGGGSVLAPALSTNLFSVLLKGIGLSVEAHSLSTDNISFQGGIGVLSKDFTTLQRVISHLAPEMLEAAQTHKPVVIIPAQGSVTLPDGLDMHELIVEQLSSVLSEYRVIEHKFQSFYDRTALIKEIEQLSASYPQFIILTLEGPIDVYGYDESIQRAFGCAASNMLTQPCSKGIVKCANLCNMTAFTVPTHRLASGFVVAAPYGIEGARAAYGLTKAIQDTVTTPELFKRYFVEQVIK